LDGWCVDGVEDDPQLLDGGRIRGRVCGQVALRRPDAQPGLAQVDIGERALQPRHYGCPGAQ
jgi:hypothetical protein